jgi:Septum formation topological specificity factor MinE
MALLSFLFPEKKKSANAAKERLQIIIARERTNRTGPDFLPALHRELIEVHQGECRRHQDFARPPGQPGSARRERGAAGRLILPRTARPPAGRAARSCIPGTRPSYPAACRLVRDAPHSMPRLPFATNSRKSRTYNLACAAFLRNLRISHMSFLRALQVRLHPSLVC